MEQRRFSGKSQWYHETQSSLCPTDIQPLVPEAAHVNDRFLLDLIVPQEQQDAEAAWLIFARIIADSLLPERVSTSRLHTLSCYERLSTALTVAQVFGVQRLCNYYAARLAPFSSPDSSRETNRRLTLLTQFARQLASQPTSLSEGALNELSDCGLSASDAVLFVQIIGFVGFQARAIALLQARQRLPVRLLPGFSGQQDAPAELFIHEGDRGWQSDLPEVIAPYATDEQTAVIESCPPESVLFALRRLLAHNAETLPAFIRLSHQFWPSVSSLTDDNVLVMLLTARINGSVGDFNQLQARWQGDPGLPDAMRNGERALQAWSHNRPRERAIIQATQVLTRYPERFSDAQFSPLLEYGLSEQQAFRLFVSAGLAGWINRLRIGLGHTLKEPKTLPF